ncbi:hypothetical protein [Acetobacterium woodii]|uniref:hypothetical protein n=1 Tax=Acetobacterium woodii TaxID=33952 RepID=UPI0002D909D2|nr:hypothetical protein [Acetobacterium woodii]
MKEYCIKTGERATFGKFLCENGFILEPMKKSKFDNALERYTKADMIVYLCLKKDNSIEVVLSKGINRLDSNIFKKQYEQYK